VTHGDNLPWRTTGYATQGRWQLYLTIPPAGGKFEGTGSQTEEEDRRYGYGLTSALTWQTPTSDVTLGGEGRFDHSNYENWFTEDAGRDARYDYLYSMEELQPWVDRARRLEERAEEVFIIANNHYRGKGPANALMILSALNRKRVRAPAELVAVCPDLAPLALPQIGGPVQGRLF